MEDTELFRKLCYYDKRNPDYDKEDEPLDKNKGICYCDNCFYGRHELAIEIMRLKAELKQNHIKHHSSS